MNKNTFAIAIDGPSGAGKSTVAKILASELKFLYVDTGAMYRAVALYGIRNKVNLDCEADVCAYLNKVNIELKYINNEQRVFLNNEDVTERLRLQDTADGASKVSRFKAVREELTAMQRDIAQKNNVVMDGRDIATCVLPNAQIKVYMDATARIRAERRVSELAHKGVAADIAETEKEIIKRDERDKNRELAPLTRHKDAVYIDTGGMTANDVALKIKNLLNTNPQEGV